MIFASFTHVINNDKAFLLKFTGIDGISRLIVIWLPLIDVCSVVACLSSKYSKTSCGPATHISSVHFLPYPLEIWSIKYGNHASASYTPCVNACLQSLLSLVWDLAKISSKSAVTAGTFDQPVFPK